MSLADRSRFALRRVRLLHWMVLAVCGVAVATFRPAANATTQEAPAAKPEEPEEDGGDILFRVTSKTQKFSVLYRHETHLKAGMECDDCHETVFKKKLDANKFKMADINKGLFCGTCHTDAPAEGVKHKAFAPKKNCAKCHSVKVHDSSK